MARSLLVKVQQRKDAEGESGCKVLDPLAATHDQSGALPGP